MRSGNTCKEPLLESGGGGVVDNVGGGGAAGVAVAVVDHHHQQRSNNNLRRVARWNIGFLSLGYAMCLSMATLVANSAPTIASDHVRV